MIDKSSGVVKFDEPRFEVGPQTTRRAFLNSDVGSRSRTVVENEPWHSWALPPLQSGLTFAVTLYFERQRLMKISIANSDPGLGTSWDDYTLEKEQERMNSHDKWLEEFCRLKPGVYRWGSVASLFDTKGGGTSIWIDYERRACTAPFWPLPYRRITPMDWGQESSAPARVAPPNPYERRDMLWSLVFISPYIIVFLLIGLVLWATSG